MVTRAPGSASLAPSTLGADFVLAARAELPLGARCSASVMTLASGANTGQSERFMAGLHRMELPLRLGWGPRLRISGAPEFVSFIGVLTLGFSVVDALRGGTQNWGGIFAAITVIVFWFWSVAVRIAMVVAVVETNDSGIRWRSFFRVRQVPWSSVEAVTIGTMLLFPGRRTELRCPVVVVAQSDGVARKVRASAWCARQVMELWARWRVAEPTSRCGEFIVRAAFAIAGRGTCVAGYLSWGDFRRNDEVRWLDGDAERQARCSGLSTLTVRPAQDPPTIGLMLADVEPSAFVEGMKLTIYR